MNMIEAASATDLLERLAALDISVPLRTEGRTKNHCERTSISRFLATFAESGLLDFPLYVDHIDRPDIVLHLSSSSIGLEITEAVPRDWAHAHVIAEENGYETFIFLQRFQPGEPSLSRNEIDRIAKRESYGSAWDGDSVECEWAEVMLYFSEHKAKKFSNPEFKKYPQNWLLIYDNWPLPALNESIAAQKLQGKLVSQDWTLPFDRVFVERSQSIWEFSRQTYISAAVNDLWKES